MMLRSTAPSLARSSGETGGVRVGKEGGKVGVGTLEGASVVGAGVATIEHAGSNATRAIKTSEIGLRIFLLLAASQYNRRRVSCKGGDWNRWYNAPACGLGCLFYAR